MHDTPRQVQVLAAAINANIDNDGYKCEDGDGYGGDDDYDGGHEEFSQPSLLTTIQYTKEMNT